MARISDDNEEVNEKVVRAFQRVFISYSQAINKQEKVRGSVFQKRFKRIHVDSEVYLSRLLFYIHYNPVSHGLVRNISDWDFSSFHALRSSKPTSIAREEVLEWFGGLDAFEKFHSSDMSGDGGITDYGIE